MIGLKNNKLQSLTLCQRLHGLWRSIYQQDDAREVDGVPLTGKLSLVDPSVNLSNQQATIRWKNSEKKGKVKIWVATANNCKTGGKDEYQLLKKASLKSKQAIVDLKNFPSSFYKIVLEGKNNSVNCWITGPKEKY